MTFWTTSIQSQNIGGNMLCIDELWATGVFWCVQEHKFFSKFCLPLKWWGNIFSPLSTSAMKYFLLDPYTVTVPM